MKRAAPNFNSCRNSNDDPEAMNVALVITTASSVAAMIHREMSFDRKFLIGSKIMSQNMAGPLDNKPYPVARTFSEGKADG
jgi:hypothetical protein